MACEWDKSPLLEVSTLRKLALPSHIHLRIACPGKATLILGAQQVSKVWGGREEHAEKHVRPEGLISPF